MQRPRACLEPAPHQNSWNLPRRGPALPRQSAKPIAQSPVREEFKQPTPPLNETAAPVIAESHPLQGMFASAPGSAAVVASRPAPVAAAPKPQSPSALSQRETAPIPAVESKPQTPALVAAPLTIPVIAPPEPPPAEVTASSVESPASPPETAQSAPPSRRGTLARWP